MKKERLILGFILFIIISFIVVFVSIEIDKSNQNAQDFSDDMDKIIDNYDKMIDDLKK